MVSRISRAVGSTSSSIASIAACVSGVSSGCVRSPKSPGSPKRRRGVAKVQRDDARLGEIRRKIARRGVEMDVGLAPGERLEIVHPQRPDFDLDPDAGRVGIGNAEALLADRRVRCGLQQRDRVRVLSGEHHGRIAEQGTRNPSSSSGKNPLRPAWAAGPWEEEKPAARARAPVRSRRGAGTAPWPPVRAPRGSDRSSAGPAAGRVHQPHAKLVGLAVAQRDVLEPDRIVEPSERRLWSVCFLGVIERCCILVGQHQRLAVPLRQIGREPELPGGLVAVELHRVHFDRELAVEFRTRTRAEIDRAESERRLAAHLHERVPRRAVFARVDAVAEDAHRRIEPLRLAGDFGDRRIFLRAGGSAR